MMIIRLWVTVFLIIIGIVAKSQECSVIKVNITTVPQFTEVRMAITTEPLFDSVLSELKCNRVIYCNDGQLKSDSLSYLGKRLSNVVNIDIRARIRIFRKNEAVVTLFFDQFGRVKSGLFFFEGSDYLFKLIGFEKVEKSK